MRDPSVSYEASDLSARGIGFFAAGLVVVVALSFAFVTLLYAHHRRHYPSTLAQPERIDSIPGPRLQASPARDLQEFRREQEARLHSYEWVDRSRGLIRLPIERAMELTAERAGKKQP